MNLTDLPRRKSGRRANLVPVPEPHQPATARFSSPAPVQSTDRRLARIEQDMATVAGDLAWLRRVLERFAADDPDAASLDPGSYDHPAWIGKPGTPAWHDDPAATYAEETPAADLTMPDWRAPRERPYAPVPAYQVPPVTADLCALPLFRATVHAELVRRAAARGDRREDGTWQEQYARQFEHVLGADLLVANWGSAS